MFGIIGWIVFGLVVGVLAKLIMPGRDPGGCLITILLGIAGALVGGFLGRFLGLYGPEEPAGFVMATLGAIVVLVIYRLVIGRSKPVD
ncbi:MAG: GlsB/YeaQ/YmgE family stress response membrane protein [Bryobacterales bacterium]